MANCSPESNTHPCQIHFICSSHNSPLSPWRISASDIARIKFVAVINGMLFAFYKITIDIDMSIFICDWGERHNQFDQTLVQYVLLYQYVFSIPILSHETTNCRFSSSQGRQNQQKRQPIPSWRICLCTQYVQSSNINGVVGVSSSQKNTTVWRLRWIRHTHIHSELLYTRLGSGIVVDLLLPQG